MWLSKAADWLNKILRPVSKVLNGVGVVVLTLLMFLTAADVIGRYTLNRPILGSMDLTEYMLAILIAFGLAYCAIIKGNVRIELVVMLFSERTQAIINSITAIFGLGLFSLITWRSFMHMMGLLDRGATSGVLYIPVFPFVGLVTLGSGLLCLVLIAEWLEFLSKAVRK